MWPLLYCVAGVRGAPVLCYGASIQVGKPSTSSLYTERWTWRGKKNSLMCCGIVVGFHWNICSRGVHIIITTEEQLIICNATLPRFTSLFFTLPQTFFYFSPNFKQCPFEHFYQLRYLFMAIHKLIMCLNSLALKQWSYSWCQLTKTSTVTLKCWPLLITLLLKKGLRMSVAFIMKIKFTGWEKNTFHMRMTSSVRIAESTEEMCTHAALMHASVDEERFTQPHPPLTAPAVVCSETRFWKKNGMKCNENPSALFANNVWADVYRRARMQVEGSLGEKRVSFSKRSSAPS